MKTNFFGDITNVTFHANFTPAELFFPVSELFVPPFEVFFPPYEMFFPLFEICQYVELILLKEDIIHFKVECMVQKQDKRFQQLYKSI